MHHDVVARAVHVVIQYITSGRLPWRARRDTRKGHDLLWDERLDVLYAIIDASDGDGAGKQQYDSECLHGGLPS